MVKDTVRLNTVEETSVLSPRERPTLDTKEVSQDKTCRPTVPWVSMSNSTKCDKGIGRSSSVPVVPEPGRVPKSSMAGKGEHIIVFDTKVLTYFIYSQL